MPNRILHSLVALLVSSVAVAQTFAPAKEAAALQQQITAASKKINTIQCDFVQEKAMSMLAEKAVSKGKFYFKREGKVRLEYLQPQKNLVVMNNGKMLLQDAKKTTQMDMHRSKVFQQLNNIIVGSINGDLYSGKEFTVKLFENGTQVKVELNPLSKTLKNFLSTIVVVLDKKDFTAQRIEMNETSGDSTILTFSAKAINGTVNESLFVVN
jgi:outer membrane lipoprotein-sorting protein